MFTGTVPKAYLHSTVVLLKVEDYFLLTNGNTNLHSTVVLLKASNEIDIRLVNEEFTFYCSSIKSDAASSI